MTTDYEDQPVWCLVRASDGNVVSGADGWPNHYNLEGARAGVRHSPNYFVARWDTESTSWVKAPQPEPPYTIEHVDGQMENWPSFAVVDRLGNAIATTSDEETADRIALFFNLMQPAR